MLTVSGRTLGKQKPLFADWSLPPPPGLGDGVTLRELIACVVRADVAAFDLRQRDRRALQVLTDPDIAKGVARGKVVAGGSDLDQRVDPDDAVATALQAFADGLYLVVVDGAELCDLDGRVELGPDSHLAFIRLIMLAGG
jgi:hypothetical protein